MCPLKAKIFCWFLLKDKELTWDVLYCKGFEGLGRCYLCKSAYESNFDIGVECSFTRQVCNEIEAKLGVKNLWTGTSVTICLNNQVLKSELKHIRSLAIIVLWFIWKTQNQCCFEDKVLSPYLVSTFSLGCLKDFPQDKVIRIRQVMTEVIDKSYPWG